MYKILQKFTTHEYPEIKKLTRHIMKEYPVS